MASIARNAISSTITVPSIVTTPAIPARKIISEPGKAARTLDRMLRSTCLRPARSRRRAMAASGLAPQAGGRCRRGRRCPLLHRRCRPRWQRHQGRYRIRGAPRPVRFRGQSLLYLHLMMLMWLVFKTLAGRGEVHDRQQHEDESLDETDEEDVESLPHDQQAGADYRSANCTHHEQRQRREADDQADDRGTGKDVAEQPHGERHRLGHLLQDVEGSEEDACRPWQLEGLREPAQVSLEA